MEVKYRIVEEISADGEWETVGVISFWPDEPQHLQLRTMLQHTVSRPIWGKIRTRAEEKRLSLKTYHDAFKGYEHVYRIFDEIQSLEADTPEEARRILREKFIFCQDELIDVVAA